MSFGLWFEICGLAFGRLLLMDQRVVLDGGEGVVVVMQESLPFGILGRLPESDGVCFQGLPACEQNVPTLLFDAALQFVRDITGSAADVGGGFGKIALKSGFLAWFDVENGNFEDHALE